MIWMPPDSHKECYFCNCDLLVHSYREYQSAFTDTCYESCLSRDHDGFIDNKVHDVKESWQNFHVYLLSRDVHF